VSSARIVERPGIWFDSRAVEMNDRKPAVTGSKKAQSEEEEEAWCGLTDGRGERSYTVEQSQEAQDENQQ